MDRMILYQGLSLPLQPAVAITPPDAWSPVAPAERLLIQSAAAASSAEVFAPGVTFVFVATMDAAPSLVVRFIPARNEPVAIPQQVASPFVANELISEWPGPQWPTYPAARQQDMALTLYQVPTVFVGNAWANYWDGPPAPRLGAAQQQVSALTPQPTPAFFVAREWAAYWDGPPSPKLGANRQQFFGLPVELVASPFVANGWQAFWDGPPPPRLKAPNQRFDNDQRFQVPSPVFSEGWRVQSPVEFRGPWIDRTVMALRLDGVPGLFTSWTVAPDRLTYATGKPGAAELDPQAVPAAAFVPNAWLMVWDGPPPPRIKTGAQRTEDPPFHLIPSPVVPTGWWDMGALPSPRPEKPAPTAAEALVRVSAPPAGWQPVEAVSVARAKQPVEVERAPTVSVRVVTGWEVVWPQGKRPAPGAGDLAEVRREPPLPAPLVDGAFESLIDYRFRRIVPPPPDYERFWRVPPSLRSRPKLLGSSTAATLLGQSTAPTLQAVSTAPGVKGEI